MSASKNISVVSDNSNGNDVYQTSYKSLSQTIARLENFFDERKGILNDRDLVQVQDTIDTAKFLRILISENRSLLDNEDVAAQLDIVRVYAFTKWTGQAQEVAIVDVVAVYNAERMLVEQFYNARKTTFSFFRRAH